MLTGDTPLIDAARHGRAADVAALLAGGADVNEPTPTLMPLATGGDTPLIIACLLGHTEVVAKLLAAKADVNQADNDGATPLYFACQNGHAEIATELLFANADVDQADVRGVTPLYKACQYGHTEVVTVLLAANADVNQADNGGLRTIPLWIACWKGHIEAAAKLLAANANVDQEANFGHQRHTMMGIACAEGHLASVQLLSSYGASRTFPFPAPRDTAEHVATDLGKKDIALWLRASRNWTRLHHLDFLTAEHTRALLRGGASANATVDGRTPLDRAKKLCMMGRAAAGSAAHVVLEWGAPWSRQTHKFYPPEVRARVADLMRIAQAIKRGKAAYEADGVFVAFASPAAVADVFESCVIPHDIASERW
jgi:ankyrin repeat protein